MATLEDEIKDLKEKNNELVQKVQFWKMTAAQKDREKLELIRETNELRLKLSKLRSSGGQQAKNLDAALQAASEKALSHLVKASAEIARTMELTKSYMQDRQELEAQAPRWSTLSGTPNNERKDKVNRVPPLMMGGQSIQPVVSLSRTIFNTSNPRAARNPNQNHSLTERAVPMHMLQDVYIPLTRIDVSELQNNNMESDTDTNNELNDSTEEMGLDDSSERLEEAQQMSDDDDFEGRRLHAVAEDIEPDITPPRSRSENPLEGPSWLLDSPSDPQISPPSGRNLEPDSTTEIELKTCTTSPSQTTTEPVQTQLCPPAVRLSREFSPTVRRRKRTSSPPPASPTPRKHYSPRPLSSRRNSTSGRVLKVLVAKMRLDDETSFPKSPHHSPPKRARSPTRDVTLAALDAPSPNGATDSAVIVSEAMLPNRDNKLEPRSRSRRQRSHSQSQSSNHDRPIAGERLTNERQTNERRTNERLANERQTNERLTNERQTNERQTNERLTNERQTNERLTNERQTNERLTSENENDRPGSYETQNSGFGSHEHSLLLLDSDSSGGGDFAVEGRTRRNRKAVVYKEKPLNRKMRR